MKLRFGTRSWLTAAQLSSPCSRTRRGGFSLATRRDRLRNAVRRFDRRCPDDLLFQERNFFLFRLDVELVRPILIVAVDSGATDPAGL
jgi:hypothetical protein